MSSLVAGLLEPKPARPIYLWQRIVHPFTAAAICCFLLVVPYFFDFTMPIFFPEFHRFATPAQHMLVSGLLAGLILSGTSSGIWTARKDTRKKHENLSFLLSPAALAVFGGLLASAWIMNLVQIPVSLTALANNATSARESIKELGGLSFIGHLYMIALSGTLVCLRLRGRGVFAVIIVTFVTAFLVAFATAERLGLIECLAAFAVFVGLYQPRLVRVSVVILVGILSTVFLALNLILRTLPMLPPAMVNQAPTLLPKIALGTVLTYYSDTMNKLYFDMFTNYYNTTLQRKFFMTTPNSFSARITGTTAEGNEEWTPLTKDAYAPTQGNYVSLDFLHGRNVMMTNPGGPAEDFLDFGWAFLILLFAKYFLLGRIYVGAKNLSPLCIALYPIFFVSALDYPRINYLYEVRGAMPMLVACIAIPLARIAEKRLRQTNTSMAYPA